MTAPPLLRPPGRHPARSSWPHGGAAAPIPGAGGAGLRRLRRFWSCWRSRCACRRPGRRLPARRHRPAPRQDRIAGPVRRDGQHARRDRLWRRDAGDVLVGAAHLRPAADKAASPTSTRPSSGSRPTASTAIVVGGHSLGGLVALAYGATHEGLAGVVALAPDGEPGDFNGHAKVAAERPKRAAAMMQAGKGDDTARIHRPGARPLLHRQSNAARLPLLPRAGQLISPRAPAAAAAGAAVLGRRHARIPASATPPTCSSGRRRTIAQPLPHASMPATWARPAPRWCRCIDWLGRLSGD